MVDIEDLREQIEKADAEIIDILVKRMQIAGQIGIYKKKHNLSALDSERWIKLKLKHQEYCDKKGLDYSLVEPIFETIHEYVVSKVHHTSK